MREDDERFEGEFEEPDEVPEFLPNPDIIEDGLTSEIENRTPRRIEEKEVEVVGVYEPQDQTLLPGGASSAFVLLRDKQNRQVLIWIGRFEAYAISVVLENITFDRPMTHDLLKNVLERLGGTVERILIDDLWQDTYYAKISVSVNGNVIDIDSRPSDAIALALRTRAPIFMAESVLAQCAINFEEQGDTPEE